MYKDYLKREPEGKTPVTWTITNVKARLPHVRVRLVTPPDFVAVGVSSGRLNRFCSVWVYDYLNPGLTGVGARLLRYPWDEVVAALNHDIALDERRAVPEVPMPAVARPLQKRKKKGKR